MVQLSAHQAGRRLRLSPFLNEEEGKMSKDRSRKVSLGRQDRPYGVRTRAGDGSLLLWRREPAD